MKKYIIQMLCAFVFSFTGVAQTVTITSSAGFTQLEPIPVSNSYATLTTGIPFGTTITYAWVATGGTVSAPNNNPTPSVQWDNTPDNTNPKSLKVTISYVSGGSTITRTDTKTVTIKHIGTIGNISVNGTNVSAGGTFANLPCTTSSITVSSAIPATYPNSSVVYQWSLPANWSTSNIITSTNTISVTPDLAGSGNISVSARRNDGTVTQTATISITRPQFSPPTISSFGTSQGVYGVASSNRVLCGSSSTTFQVTGGNATSYSWQTTGGVSASSISSSANVSASSDGTIRIYPVSACGIGTGNNYALVNIKTGAPGTPNFLADGDGNSFVNMCAGNSKFLVANSDRANSLGFQLLNGSANLILSQGNTATFNTFNIGTFRVQANAPNCNGSGSNTKYINVINCSSAFKVGPNPASSTISIVYDTDTPTDLMPDNIKLIDGKMKEYFSMDVKDKIKSKTLIGYTIELDVSKFARGEYYLHTINVNHPDKEKRLEKVKVILQ